MPAERMVVRLTCRFTNGTELEPNGKPVEVIYCGTFHLADRGQVIEITEAQIDQMVANFAGMEESGRIPVTVNHAGNSGILEEARAVGWLVGLGKKQDGDRCSLMATPHWLEDAREAIDAGQFQFVSAEIVWNDTNTLTGEAVGCHLCGLSLTPYPAIPQLDPIELSRQTTPTKVQQAVARFKSLFDQIDEIAAAFYAKFPDTNLTRYYLIDLDEAAVYAERNKEGEGKKCFRVPYLIGTGGVDFAAETAWVEVVRSWQPASQYTAAGRIAEFKAIPAHTPPKAPDGMSWDAAAAKTHLKDWSTTDGEMDMAKYRTGFGWIDAEAPDMMGSCKLPHHDIVDGTFVVVRAGMIAAANALQGGRGGVEIPSGEVAGVRRHLATHYNQFGMDPPWAGSAAKSGTQLSKEKVMDELRKLLGLAEDADVEAAVAALVADLAAVKQQVESLTAEKGTLESQIADLSTQAETKVAEAEAALTAVRTEVTTLSAGATAFEATRLALQQEIDTLKVQKADRDAQDRIDQALRLGKVTPAELEAESGFLKSMAHDQPETWDKLMGTRKEDTSRFQLQSQTSDPAPEASVDEIFRLQQELMDKDSSLTATAAREKIFAQRPDLKAITEKEA